MATKIFQNVEVQGDLRVTGTYGASVKLPVLTTAMRDALTAEAGMTIFNSTTGRREVYNGSAWESIEDGAIVEEKLGDEAVTGPKIKLEAIDATHISNALKQELGIGTKEVRANEHYGLLNNENR